MAFRQRPRPALLLRPTQLQFGRVHRVHAPLERPFQRPPQLPASRGAPGGKSPLLRAPQPVRPAVALVKPEPPATPPAEAGTPRTHPLIAQLLPRPRLEPPLHREPALNQHPPLVRRSPLRLDASVHRPASLRERPVLLRPPLDPRVPPPLNVPVAGA